MKKATLTLLILSALSPVFGQASNPISAGSAFHYALIKRLVTAAADRMPEEHYKFQPLTAPDVRTFAQLIGHLADSNFRLCSIIAGADAARDEGIERSKSTKADLLKALADSFVFCDQVHAKMTDAAIVAMVKFDAGGEGTRVPLEPMPKVTAFAFHTAHAFEHYGNMVTYMRMKEILPPSSALPPKRPISVTVNPNASRGPYNDVGGQWALSVETPNGPVLGFLTLTIKGTQLTGEANTDRGIVPLTGTLTAAEIQLTGTLQTLRITFSGKPNSVSMTGTVNFGGRDSGTWSATRQ